jgi:hypothetical protein
MVVVRFHVNRTQRHRSGFGCGLADKRNALERVLVLVGLGKPRLVKPVVAAGALGNNTNELVMVGVCDA